MLNDFKTYVVLKPAHPKVFKVSKFETPTFVKCNTRIEDKQLTIDVDYSHLHNIAKTDLIVYYSFANEHPSKDKHLGVISGLEPKWHIVKPPIKNQVHEHDHQAKFA